MIPIPKLLDAMINYHLPDANPKPEMFERKAMVYKVDR